MATENSTPSPFILKISCEARSGIVAAVTTFLSERGCYISDLSQFDDRGSGRFFMRAVGFIETCVEQLSDLRELRIIMAVYLLR